MDFGLDAEDEVDVLGVFSVWREEDLCRTLESTVSAAMYQLSDSPSIDKRQ